jgi:DNA-binding CsgD family transcriptional regulator
VGDVADSQRRICEIASQSVSIADFRRLALEIIRESVAHDVALFHELSPRVPLSRAAMIGIDVGALDRSRGSWDEMAVVLGSLRDAALAHGGVASVTSVLAPGSKPRRAWDQRIAPMLHAREAMMTHLVVEGRIVSAIVQGRRTTPFTEPEAQWMRALVPTLAVCDALRQLASDASLRGLAAHLECVDQRLTERQQEIVVFVALGHTDAGIASALSISANTVRNHLVDIRTRLGAANRAEIVRLAVLR